MVTAKGKFSDKYTYIRNLLTRLNAKTRMIRQYAPVRNRLLVRNGVLVSSGLLMANGIWIVAIILLFVGFLVDEL